MTPMHSVAEVGNNSVGGRRASADDGGSARSGFSFTVGTAAELIARGPPQPCAGCTRTSFDQGPYVPRMDGLFFQRGWSVLCSTHEAIARSEEPRSYTAPFPDLLPTPARVRQPTVVSISERWRLQQQMKKRKAKRQRQLKETASHASATAPP